MPALILLQQVGRPAESLAPTKQEVVMTQYQVKTSGKYTCVIRQYDPVACVHWTEFDPRGLVVGRPRLYTAEAPVVGSNPRKTRMVCQDGG